MSTKLYVGGLPYSVTEQQLNDLFAQQGSVTSAKVITDKYTGQSRGFGFVEMSTPEEAKKAISALNGTQLDGRSLTVNEAKPRKAARAAAAGSAGRAVAVAAEEIAAAGTEHLPSRQITLYGTEVPQGASVPSFLSEFNLDFLFQNCFS